MSKAISNSSADTSFITEVKQILEQARQKAYSATALAMIEGYWLMGERIVQQEQQGKQRAEYGTELINGLSLALGKGFSPRMLRDIRQFYITFPDFQDLAHTCAKLNWSHFRSIMRVSDKNARAYYLKEANQNNWAVRTLERNINTLFVDKNVRYHGLMQAFSRTNRIYDATKTFGNIVTFRNLENATIEAITLFGDKNTKNVVLEKSYKEYLEGFTDIVTGEARRGYVEVVKELNEKFPNPDEIVKEKDKKEFAKLFGEYLRVENILQNYDEFNHLKALQGIDINNPEIIEEFKKAHFVTDEDIAAMQKIELLKERTVQDYRSTYNDIRDWLRREKSGKETEESNIDWDDVVFEVDLLKSQEINLDYILELIFEHNKKNKNKTQLVEEIRRVIRSSIGNRAKESLVVDFINETDLEKIKDKANVLDSFYAYAQGKLRTEVSELITDENLNEEAAKRYITTSLKREYASENGTELNALLPKMSPLNPQYLTKKQSVFQKLVSFVEKFKGVGGQL